MAIIGRSNSGANDTTKVGGGAAQPTHRHTPHPLASRAHTARQATLHSPRDRRAPLARTPCTLQSVSAHRVCVGAGLWRQHTTECCVTLCHRRTQVNGETAPSIPCRLPFRRTRNRSFGKPRRAGRWPVGKEAPLSRLRLSQATPLARAPPASPPAWRRRRFARPATPPTCRSPSQRAVTRAPPPRC